MAAGAVAAAVEADGAKADCTAGAAVVATGTAKAGIPATDAAGCPNGFVALTACPSTADPPEGCAAAMLKVAAGCCPTSGV